MALFGRRQPHRPIILTGGPPPPVGKYLVFGQRTSQGSAYRPVRRPVLFSRPQPPPPVGKALLVSQAVRAAWDGSFRRQFPTILRRGGPPPPVGKFLIFGQRTSQQAAYRPVRRPLLVSLPQPPLDPKLDQFDSKASPFNGVGLFDVGPPLARATLLQHTLASFSSSSNPQQLAYLKAVTAGSLLVLAVGIGRPVAVTVTVADSLGQTWSQAGSYVNANDGSCRIGIFCFAATSAGPCTVAVTPSAGNYLTLALAVFSGVTTTLPPVDATSGNFNTVADLIPSTGMVPTADLGVELIVAAYTQDSVNETTCTGNPPFAILDQELLGLTKVGLCLAADVEAVVREGASFILSPNATKWAALGVSFTPALQPPPPVRQFQKIGKTKNQRAA